MASNSVIGEEKNGMTYYRYTKRNTGPGKKYRVGQRIDSEFVTRIRKIESDGMLSFEDLQRRPQKVKIVAITLRVHSGYKDTWYKLELFKGFSYWSSNVKRITRYVDEERHNKMMGYTKE